MRTLTTKDISMLSDRLKSFGAVSGLAFALATPAVAADKVTFQLDWLPGGDKAPIYVCINKGICKDAGLDVTISPGRGSTDAITRLASNASDIGVSDIGALMAARAREGVGVTAVLSVFNKGPHAFYTVEGQGITKVADVKGKKIATSPFTSSNVFLPLVLEDVGLKENDISLVKADPGALGPMLMTGASDVIIAWMTDLTRYGGQAGEAGKKIVALPWSSAGLELYSASLIASDRFLKERPDVARRFVEAYKKSIEFCRTNPAEASAAVTAMVSELGAEDVRGSMNDALALVYNDVTDRDGLGVFEPARLAATWTRVAKAQGIDGNKLDPETVVNRSYMPKQ
jgi:NitT/TauT family transport system substrate-binding protein